MARPRAPGGCPWDREQTFDSVRRYTLEETYEVFDAIERRDWVDLREELGDLLLQVLFYAQMAAEEGRFTIADVVDTLNAKLIRRHPHVFGELVGKNVGTERVLSNWEAFKQEERREKAAVKATNDVAEEGLLTSVPRNFPATLEAQKIGSKAAKVGFDWPSVEGLFAKLEEEAGELQAEISSGDYARAEGEVGDLLFTAVQLARHLRVDAEMALRGTNARFRARIAAMEQSAAGRGQQLSHMKAEELEVLWTDAKSAPMRKFQIQRVAIVSNSVIEAVEIRGCHGPAEMRACVELQQRAWGFSDLETVPGRLFVVAEKIGGQVLGAWDGEHLAGFAMALPGLRDGKVYLHSHMVAVDAPYRAKGLGHRLKMAQGEDGLRRGFGWMEWTFDPLQPGNAHFNLQKLGAVARRYLPHHYGPLGSKLQAGLPSDRLVAEWFWAKPETTRPVVERVEIAADIDVWRQNPADAGKALAEQMKVREALQSAFSRGLVAVGFERGERGGGSYLLAEDPV